ncbi:pyruvate dehydrogenase E2 component (dihydrolipoamide acetyltransferase) [Fictibacillus enclensis]|uniref:Dihydrolipoamide acetyltransferase component of pyruvate dehydrogenase complex n=1 Tax=Fictibacillus enclensis TaxID=1017270 RepID=A0A0V8JBZ5_9BACL|nr:dihydrolipoamide acetyltransferase family protein [Fictibacillus enclensis]KSU84144.1 dihydrolipoyllysine acetyltransferase [Fictibacillus enclensis]SCB73809.1 pyruvate dehydrogenase E2 component (dihydrolipoamide acetyltransferase) [Fictibacillus enclensis]
MVEVKLHDIGEGMHEGEILHFFVKTGDVVSIDQPLVEVQTDKVTAELPSPVAGKVTDILVKEGETVTVGTVLLCLESEGASAVPQTPKSQEPLMEAGADSSSSSGQASLAMLNKRVLAAPYTRKVARDYGVDIEQITGTGPAGRITEEDVLRFVNGTKTSIRKEQPDAPTINKELPAGETEEIPFRGRRKQIAKKMTQSLFTIPHVTHFEEVDMTNVLELKKQLKMLDPDKSKGFAISVASFFIKAIQLALADFPVFNSKLDEEKEVIRLEKQVNIGIATDAEDGLIVPVIKNVERRSIKDINRDMKKKITKAKEGTLTREDLTGGTFTISNVGPLGSMGATPIINAPEVALMAFHKTKKMPVVIHDDIQIRSVMNVSMSFDHRVADGATAVQFTNRFKELIENPSVMVLELI